MSKASLGKLAAGVQKLSAPYALLVPVLVGGSGGFLYGVLSAPTIKAHQMPPGWFGSFFTAMLAFLCAAFFALLVPLAKSDYRPWTTALTLACMIAGIVASIIGLREGVSDGGYAYVLAVADGAVAVGLLVSFVMVIGGAVAFQRRKSAAALKKVHGG
jgi:hypothetical protein